MNKVIELDTRESIRTVTSNSFITARGLETLSLKARKLLYVAISQCKKNDHEFYEYTVKVTDFAEMMDIAPSHVYEVADSLTDELMKGIIRVVPEGQKGFKKYSLFSKCEYEEDGEIKIKLNKDMTSFLLELKGNFTKPLLDDFLRMNSPYSMAIWHLMQMKMHSNKPRITEFIEFDLTVKEIREVTGTESKFKQIGELKSRVLDKALREIKDNCNVVVKYTNIKKSRTITGFHFVVESPWHIDEDSIPQATKDKINLFQLKQAAKTRELTKEEKAEYDRLTANAEQIEMSF